MKILKQPEEGKEGHHVPRVSNNRINQQSKHKIEGGQKLFFS